MITNDLTGPAGGSDEELDQREDRVTGHYLVGMLAPKSTAVEAEGQDALDTGDKDDPGVAPTEPRLHPPRRFSPIQLA